LYRYFVSLSCEFCRHKLLCCVSKSVCCCCCCCCLFRYRLNPETFEYTLLCLLHTHGKTYACSVEQGALNCKIKSLHFSETVRSGKSSNSFLWC